jgi:hypothetical protein
LLSVSPRRKGETANIAFDRSKRALKRSSGMRTAEDCRRKAAEMYALAANSPGLRPQYLEMAEEWERLERRSAEAEGMIDPEP